MPSYRRAAVFLDRDGVLARPIVRGGRPYPPRDVEELELLPGVEAACRELRAAGFVLVVVTNQPDIARGIRPYAAVQRINERLGQQLPLDDVVMCPHDDEDRCACRKPQPGMLTAAARRWGVDLTASFMVGDRWRDVEAGERAGCRTIFIDRGYTEAAPKRADAIACNLPAAAAWILAVSKPGGVRSPD